MTKQDVFLAGVKNGNIELANNDDGVVPVTAWSERVAHGFVLAPVSCVNKGDCGLLAADEISQNVADAGP